jgi:hypothetical protein
LDIALEWMLKRYRLSLASSRARAGACPPHGDISAAEGMGNASPIVGDPEQADWLLRVVVALYPLRRPAENFRW